MIHLEAIAFNHDPTAATHDAFNLRRSATAWVTVPEWRRGTSVVPEDSPAAYARAQVTGHRVTIKAEFSCTDPSIADVEVRAKDNFVSPPGPPGCFGWLIALIRAILRALFGNVLGKVQARPVAFINGQSGLVEFTLVNTKLSRAPIGPHTTEWRWQFRRPARKKWHDLTVTRHRIYLVLDIPTAPWQQTPYQPANIQLPWTSVLDYACQWALGTTNAIDAAGGVTRGVNNLGPNIVTYDCPGGGNSWYSAGAFDCTAFIDRLKGGLGDGYYVNCSDCATFVSTFANILGCDLWQSRMGSGFFHLNPILGIGSNTWQPACHGIDGWADGFGYHEVAWTGACGANDNVFDACLHVDGDADPTAAPHTAQLPVNVLFGNPGDMQYRDRLTIPADLANCSPLPGTRQRRAVG